MSSVAVLEKKGDLRSLAATDHGPRTTDRKALRVSVANRPSYSRIEAPRAVRKVSTIRAWAALTSSSFSVRSAAR